jgi:hypothetical protein
MSEDEIDQLMIFMHLMDWDWDWDWDDVDVDVI